MRLALAAALVALILPGSASAGEWLSGDLHVHTTYSHDSYGGPGDDNTHPDEDPADLITTGQTVTEDFAVAASRGLDYLAITDHNDIRSWSDPGYGLGGVIPIRAYENSLQGHAQMLGATKVYDNGDKSPEAIQRLMDEIHADGGLLQANHPCDANGGPDWEYPDLKVDSSEVWSLPWVYQPPFPAAGPHECALRHWYGYLNRGWHVTATGASDSHWKSTLAGQGPGQPTTWVYASDRSQQGVIEGIRAGRTFISHQPPNLGGPMLYLEADANGDGTYESMVGDTVPGLASLRVRVEGAPGASVQIVTDKGKSDAVPVTSHDFSQDFDLPEDATWVHAMVYGEDANAQRDELDEPICKTLPFADLSAEATYCTDQILMLALTSAIFLREEPVQ